MTDSAPTTPAIPAAVAVASTSTPAATSSPPAPAAAPTYADGHGDALTSVLALVAELDTKVQSMDLRLDDIRKLRADIALLAIPSTPEH